MLPPENSPAPSPERNLSPLAEDELATAEDWRRFQAFDDYFAQLEGRRPGSSLAQGRETAPGAFGSTDASAQAVQKCLERLDDLTMFGRPKLSPTSSNLLPARLGPYELGPEIGRGGMGVVFRARHTGLNCNVALKIIRASELATDDDVRRFHREARAAAMLAHPHIIRVHDVAEQNGLHYLTMDLVEGGSLAQRLRRAACPPQDAAAVMVAVARAVDYLHGRGIIHRDLKPGNILLDASGRPFVTDFGLAKLDSSQDSRTLSGTILGTPDYMSPEQASGHPGAVTRASDLFSLGAILFEMLTGQPPFHGPTPLDTLLQVLESEPPAPRSLNPQVSAELEYVCLRCLEKEPVRRYSTAAALADDLQKVLDGEPLDLPRISFGRRVLRGVRRMPALASHLFAIALAAVIIQSRAMFVSVERDSHILVMCVLAVWAGASWLLQRWMLTGRAASAAQFTWAAVDVICYTLLLHLSEQWGWATGMLSAGYAVMITASALWMRVRLIWFMTAVCVASQGVLRLLHPELHAGAPTHFSTIAAVMLVAVGANASFQVNRIKVLSRLYDRRGLEATSSGAPAADTSGTMPTGKFLP